MHTPKVNSSVVSFCAATTAQRPMMREMMSLSMWKASAVKASEWARKPEMSSRKKNDVSMAIIILMRVLLESPDLEGAMTGGSVSVEAGVEPVAGWWRHQKSRMVLQVVSRGSSSGGSSSSLALYDACDADGIR